jgi:hypothetical protein
MYGQLLNIERGIAAQTDRSTATSIKIESQDLERIQANSSNPLAVHCMTSLDDISATAVTSGSYDSKSATKLLNKLIYDFASYHESNPTGNDFTAV